MAQVAVLTYVKGSVTTEDARVLVAELKKRGIDLLELPFTINANNVGGIIPDVRFLPRDSDDAE